MKPRVVVFGASAHASVVADILRRRDEFTIVGFLDDVNPERKGESFCGASVLGGAEVLEDLLNRGVRHGIVGFGHSRRRLGTTQAMVERGFDIVTAIHPDAVVGSSTSVGEGAVIKAGAIVDPGASVGRGAILGSGAVVTHGAILGDGARLAAGAVIGADVRLETCAFVGLSATVSTRVTVGAFALVGAGALVLEDVPEGMVAYGVPARTVRAVADESI